MSKNTFRFKPSLRRAYLFGILFLIAAVNGFYRLQEFDLGYNIPVASVGLLVVFLLYAHLVRLCTAYTVSDEFVEARSGILARKGNRAAISRITDFAANQSLLQRILGLASVEMSTAGGDGPEIIFHDISRGVAKKVVSTLTELTAQLDARERAVGNGNPR